MLLSVQCWLDVTTIIANIVTILGILGLVGIGISLIRNRFSIKTVTVKIKKTGTYTNYNSPSLQQRISISIDLLNSTDKTFFVTGIIFSFSKCEIDLKSENKNYPMDNIVRNICIDAFAAKTITGWIEVPKEFKLPDNFSVKIKTTVKDLNYNLNF